MKLPPLKTLPVFEAVARLGSFSLAASELNISQSAVSHQIRQLEDYLGEPLFLRTGRRIHLTEEGSSYHEQITTALSHIERASGQLQGEEDTQLRLAIYSSFAVSWLIPRLPRLQRQHPQIDLDLEMLSELPRMSDRIGDAFIAINPDQRGFSSDLLYRERLFPVCSRLYWRQMIERFHADGLTDETEPDSVPSDWVPSFTLLSATSIFDKKNEDWRRWLAADDHPLPRQTRVQHFSHMLLAHEAARHHQGIALSNDYMFNPDDPVLVPLPCHELITGDEFHFAFKTARRNEPGIRLLRQWLLTEAIRSGLRKEQ